MGLRRSVCFFVCAAALVLNLLNAFSRIPPGVTSFRELLTVGEAGNGAAHAIADGSSAKSSSSVRNMLIYVTSKNEHNDEATESFEAEHNDEATESFEAEHNDEATESFEAEHNDEATESFEAKDAPELSGGKGQPSLSIAVPPKEPWHCKPPKRNPFNITCPPRIIIAGTMKCGTNEAGVLLGHHPRIKFKLCSWDTCEAGYSGPRNCTPHDCATVDKKNEVQGWLSKTGSWSLWESQAPFLLKNKTDIYMARFPDTDGVNNITIDKSPAFEDFDEFPQVVKEQLPGARIVLSVCDPVERLRSQFQHNHDNVPEYFNWGFTKRGLNPPEDFGDYLHLIQGTSSQCHVNPEGCESLRQSVLSEGSYTKNIKNWLEVFDKDEILVIDMTAPQVENAKKMVQHAGLPMDEYPWDGDHLKEVAFSNTNYKGRGGVWDDEPPEPMKWLARQFAPLNKELATLVEDVFPLKWRSSTEGLEIAEVS